MPLTLPVNTVDESLRTDCYILGDKKKISAALGKSVLCEVLLCIPYAPSCQLQEVSLVPSFLLKNVSSSVIKFMTFFHVVT